MKLFEMSDYNRTARLLWWSFVSLGACIALWSLGGMTAWHSIEWLEFALLTALVTASSSQSITIPSFRESDSVSASDAFVFLGVMLLGVPCAVWLCVIDALIAKRTQRLTTRLAAPAIMAISIFIAAHGFYLTLNCYPAVTAAMTSRSNIAGEIAFSSSSSSHVTAPVFSRAVYPLGIAATSSSTISNAALVAALAVMALTMYFVNCSLVAAIHAAKKRVSFFCVWREHYIWTSINFFAAALAAGFIYHALVHVGILYVVLGIAIIAATILSYKVYFERMNEKTVEAAEMSRLHLATVEALATAIDAKDQMTHFHVRRVQHYCLELAKLFNLSEPEIKALRAGTLLHDIGKLAVPDHILNKPGELSAAEFERMKIHTRVGAQILERVEFPYPVIPIVLYHHERWDGCGYPEGLRGEQIPITARILAVADAFDTVREARPYRQALSCEEASHLLRRGAGTHFDPQVVRVFLDNLEAFDCAIAAANNDYYGNEPVNGDMREIVASDKAFPPPQQIISTSGSRAASEIAFGDARSATPLSEQDAANDLSLSLPAAPPPLAALLPPVANPPHHYTAAAAAAAVATPMRPLGVTAMLPSASNILGGKRHIALDTDASVNQVVAPPVAAAVAPGVTSIAAANPNSVPAYLNHIRDAHREAHALYDIARTFGSSLDLQDIVAIIAGKIGNVVAFDTCAVYLYNEVNQTATVAHATGSYAEVLRSHTIALGENLVGFVLANQCSIRSAPNRFDAMLDWEQLVLPEGAPRFESAMALPLVRENRLLGALVVYAFALEAYTADHLRLLESVTRLAADALSNAMLHAEIESNALTDALTGLPNARALHARFEEEAARARRSGGSFQVMMLDLDSFKQVNDTFGHRTGDTMLREISNVLNSHMREYDFLARYAGDEFVAIVQDLDLVQMAELRRRIERAVNGFSLHVRGNASARVGISIGAARFPSDGETLDSLLMAADAAMYNQKAQHKKGVPSATETDDDISAAASVVLDNGDLASTAIN